MKIYRINWMTGGGSPVYKTSKAEVREWLSRNPGEADSWEAVDVIEELNHLHEELRTAEDRVDRLERKHAVTKSAETTTRRKTDERS